MREAYAHTLPSPTFSFPVTPLNTTISLNTVYKML